MLKDELVDVGDKSYPEFQFMSAIVTLPHSPALAWPLAAATNKNTELNLYFRNWVSFL